MKKEILIGGAPHDRDELIYFYGTLFTYALALQPGIWATLVFSGLCDEYEDMKALEKNLHGSLEGYLIANGMVAEMRILKNLSTLYRYLDGPVIKDHIINNRDRSANFTIEKIQSQIAKEKHEETAELFRQIMKRYAFINSTPFRLLVREMYRYATDTSLIKSN